MRKKVITRVLAVLSCLLLVVLFALPCFADSGDYYNSDAYDSFMSSQITSKMNTDSFEQFTLYYEDVFGSELAAQSAFFKQYAFASGNVQLDGRVNPFDVPIEGLMVYEQVNFSLVVNGAAFNQYGVVCTMAITPMFVIELGDSCEIAGLITSDDTVRISYVNLNGTTITRSQIQSISLSVGSNEVASGSSSGFVNIISSLLFPTPTYDYLTYPASYYDGYISIHNEDAYQTGYNDAINDAGSGAFGRNFLSGIFTAPLNALRSFTLVEWTTANGTFISINLLTILSAVIGLALFIWFLKMFAGG